MKFNFGGFFFVSMVVLGVGLSVGSHFASTTHTEAMMQMVGAVLFATGFGVPLMYNKLKFGKILPRPLPEKFTVGGKPNVRIIAVGFLLAACVVYAIVRPLFSLLAPDEVRDIPARGLLLILLLLPLPMLAVSIYKSRASARKQQEKE